MEMWPSSPNPGKTKAKTRQQQQQRQRQRQQPVPHLCGNLPPPTLTRMSKLPTRAAFPLKRYAHGPTLYLGKSCMPTIRS
mmetsp:Transcript_7861/g.15921  ORF Transcript_7861/g.15921 Transcript_7861/m.15921 type:complete len:80 (+) Transcript_7861:356-595(+)